MNPALKTFTSPYFSLLEALLSENFSTLETLSSPNFENFLFFINIVGEIHVKRNHPQPMFGWHSLGGTAQVYCVGGTGCNHARGIPWVAPTGESRGCTRTGGTRGWYPSGASHGCMGCNPRVAPAGATPWVAYRRCTLRNPSVHPRRWLVTFFFSFLSIFFSCLHYQGRILYLLPKVGCQELFFLRRMFHLIVYYILLSRKGYELVTLS